MIDIWKEFLDEFLHCYNGEKIISIFLLCAILFVVFTGFYKNIFLGIFEVILFFFITPLVVCVFDEYLI